MDTSVDKQPHAILVPGPGLGHVNGMVLLAKALLSAGFRVTMACFERIYRTHADKGRLSLSHMPIRVELVADGLASDASSFTDLFDVTPSMRRNLLLLLRSLSSQDQPPTCLVSDTIMAWTQHVAEEVGIPRVEYWTASATAYLTVLAVPELLARGYVGSHTGEVPRSWKSKEPVSVDFVLGHSSFDLDEIPSDFRYAAMDDFLLQRFLEAAQLVSRAYCILFHSAYELESHTFEALQLEAQLAAYPIGPLLQQSPEATSANSTLTWLDIQAPSSVLYVSFGSTVVHTKDEIIELAHGLEASGKPFLWVVRSDALPEGCAPVDIFPRGFHKCIADRGLIVPWVSQLDVLAHPAVGGFLSHCGWNSVLESLWMGVPLLACPQRADQPTNTRLVVREWGVGIELHTSLEEGTPSRIDIGVGIRALMDDPVGDSARRRAKDFKCMLRKSPTQGGKSHANLLHFASKMKELCLSKAQ